MVDTAHLGKLKKGFEVWNAWRNDNPAIVPALWRAELEGIDLRRADLKKADFEEADLGGADLREADLREAKLRGADLREANLEGANLLGAELKRTNLEGTNLRWAMYLQAKQLCEANTLYKAKLDPELERDLRHEQPLLFEKPRENTNR